MSLASDRLPIGEGLAASALMMSARLLMLFDAGSNVASPRRTAVRLISIDVPKVEVCFSRANYSLLEIFFSEMKHLVKFLSYNFIMSTGGKIVLSVGVASSALLAAWLFSGDRRSKTKAFVTKRAAGLRDALKSEKVLVDDQIGYYI